MPFVWVPERARFRDQETGRFVAQKTVREYTVNGRKHSEEVLKTLASEWASGQRSTTDFRNRFRQELKEEAIRQYVLGRGGLGSMENADWGRLGAYLKDQYSYLKGFEADGNDLSEAAASARASLYARATGAAYERGRLASHRASGTFNEERWELGDAEHCSDCEELSAKGWVPIGTLGTVPRAGTTACLVNCECNISYR